MANLEFINNEFKQSDGVCALASYRTAIEYFSKKRIICERVLTNYFERYDLFDKTSGVFYFEEKHKLIFDHFHEYCKLKELRGLNYIKQLHENNDLLTRDYCQITDIQASKELIVEKDLFPVRDILRDQDALAMILYKSGVEKIDNVIKEYYHAITIGYDNTQNQF